MLVVMYLQKALMILSTLLLVIANFLSGAAWTDVTVVSYVCLILSISIVTIVVIKGVIESGKHDPVTKLMLNVIFYTGPFIYMLLLCAALMTITIKKKSLIISGNVSDKYGTFRTISSVLLSAQLLLVGNEINKKGLNYQLRSEDLYG